MKNLIVILGLLLVSSVVEARSVQLALNWKPEPQFGGFYTAELEGIFKSRGLDVSVIPGGAGTPTIQVVAAGKAEYGIVSGEEVLISRSRGTDIVALFSTYQINPRSIMVHSERKLSSLQDLFRAPGTIGIQQGLPFFQFLENKYGKAKGRIVPYLGGISNFLNDPNYSQQAFHNSEPVLAEKKGAKVSSFLVSDAGFNPYTTVVVARNSYIMKNPEATKNLILAIREGWRRYLEAPTKTNLYMHQLNPAMDEKTFEEGSLSQRKFIETPEVKGPGLGSMTHQRWSELAEQLKSLGVINKIPEVNDLFQNP